MGGWTVSILTANLRHLYQRRGLWLAYAMFAFFVCVSVGVPLGEPTAGEGRFIGLIVLAFLIGMAAAVLQAEILTRPMAFCLPGHRLNVRTFVLRVGIVANLVAAWLFLGYPGLPFGWRVLVLWSAFSAGLGFTIVLLLMAGIRERLEMADIPESLKGVPVAFIVAGLMAIAFLGFSGLAAE